MRTRLRLSWNGVSPSRSLYIVPERADRAVAYANREDLGVTSQSNKAENADMRGAYAVSGRGGIAHEPAVDKPRRRGGKQMKPMVRRIYELLWNNLCRHRTAPPERGAVYMYLRDRADSEGKCWPGIKTIASDMRLSRSTVKRALTDLEQHGYLQKDSHATVTMGAASQPVFRAVRPQKKRSPPPRENCAHYWTQGGS